MKLKSLENHHKFEKKCPLLQQSRFPFSEFFGSTNQLLIIVKQLEYFLVSTEQAFH